ncbi:MAG TPA: GDSL-type esterase/lipase family protein [Pedococcus sp.]|jgi:lysophospholipase L1-like esterase|nr:GDSL-type esterase/lipase family protein [Pedococcus sp.]
MPKPDTTPVVVVGLGDSVTAGSACGCTTFVGLYASMLHQRSGRSVAAANLGEPGLTSTGLSAQLGDPQVRAQLAKATLVVLTIGANDLEPLISRWQAAGCDASCVEPATAAMGANLSIALSQVSAVVSPKTRVLVTNYWNVFEDGDVGEQDYGKAFHAWSDSVTRSANAHICAAAAAAGDTCVDIYEPFEGAGDRNPTALLAGDGDHPNAAGHQLIAEALIQADPLAQES